MSLGFAGRVCVVSGGSRGIGRAIASLLSSQGSSLVVLGRNAERVQHVALELPRVAEGQRHFGFSCDVSSRAAIQSLMEQLRCSGVTGVHHLVNCAGVTRDCTLPRVTDADLDAILGTNLRGPIVLSQEMLPLLKAAKGNRSIVNVGSVVGSAGNFGQCVYSSSKAGLIGFTKSLSKELGRQGIRVNLVQPGFTNTDLTKNVPDSVKQNVIDRTILGRFAEPSEIASAIVFILSDAASFITGQVLSVDGGLSL